jgi:photosystem II stability/assembly factor-like uncharacterized protein
MRQICLLLALAVLQACGLTTSPESPTLDSSSQAQKQNLGYALERKGYIENDFINAICFWSQQNGIATGLDQKFWITSDNGNSWNEHLISVGNRKGYDLVDVVITASGYIYILGHLEDVGSAIFSSFDGGKSWQEKYFDESTLDDICSFDDDVWVIGEIFSEQNTSQSGPVLLHCVNRDKWQTLWQWSGNQPLNSIYFSDRSNGWAVGSKGVIMRTKDGGKAWELQSGEKNEGTLNKVVFADLKQGWAVGQNGLILCTKDGGVTWQKKNVDTNANFTNISTLTSQISLVVGQKGSVALTTNGGESWSLIDSKTRADIYATTVSEGNLLIATSEGEILILHK